MQKKRILLADDHPVVREGLRALVDAQPDMEVVGEAADGNAAVDAAESLVPDVVVLDLSMPGLNGVQTVRQMRSGNAAQAVLVLSMHDDPAHVRQVKEAGAAGYVPTLPTQDFLHALRTVAEGGTSYDPSLFPHVPEDPDFNEALPELSDREAEVIRLIAEGFSNKEIASRLALSVKTVETYKSRSLEKLGLHSRVDIVRYAARRGWLLDMDHPNSG